MKRSIFILVLVSVRPSLPGQASDLVDMKDLLGRGVYFETEGTWPNRIDGCISVGDVNGDGLSDIGLTRYFPDAAHVYCIFGSPGRVGRDVIRPDLPGSIHYVSSGRSLVVSVGDLNRDGYSELAFTSSSTRPLFTDDYKGALFIVHGRPAFTDSGGAAEEVGTRIPGSMIYTTRPETDQAGFNGHCAVVDINGDGRSDLAVGSTYRDWAGYVHVLLETGDLGPDVDLADVGQDLPGFTLETPGLLNLIEDAGDFDGDGIHDLLIADGRRESLTNGSVYLFFGRHDPAGHYDLDALSRVEDRVLRFFLPPRYYLFFAHEDQAAGVGDVDGDGFDDILLGETYYGFNLEENLEGKAHLVYGTNRTGLGPDPLATLRTTVFHGTGSGFQRDEFGGKVNAAGDMTGDGIPDLLIGAPQRTVRQDREGEAYLVYGRRDFGPEVRLADGFAGMSIRGNTQVGRLGHYFGPAGDFNGDGDPDLVIGDPLFTKAYDGTSKAIVIFGSGSEKPPVTVVSPEPSFGFLRGGTLVRIRGSGFEPGARVRFGANEATVVKVSPAEIEARSPPGAGLGPVAVAVSVGTETRFSPVLFEYVEDRPEIDLESPGRWGLRIDGFAGAAIGTGLDFADIDGDGIDDLLVASDLVRDWLVTIVRGRRGLPSTLDAFTPEPGERTLVHKRAQAERVVQDVRVRNIGDVNGDGIADAAAAAFLESGYLLLGRRSLASELDFEEEVALGRAVRLLFDPNSRADFAPLGDLTGDGVSDFAIGLSSDSVLFVEGRRVWPEEIDLHDPQDTTIFSRLFGSGARFARRIARAGDANGDGHPELLVTADPSSLPGLSAYLLYTRSSLVELPASASLHDYASSGGGVSFELLGDSASAASISGPGDVNGDGLADLLIGKEGGIGAGRDEGILFLVHGRRDFPDSLEFPEDLGPIDLDGVVRIGEGGLVQARMAVGPAGDYDGDGSPDFTVVSAPHELLAPYRLHVVLGGADLPPVLALDELGRHGFELDGLHPYTLMQNGISAPGDLNADGAPDFAFAEYGIQGSSAPAGSVHVVFGIPPSVPFVRGDTNHDGQVDITDAIATLGFLFVGQGRPACEDAADADDRGTIEITDAVYVLNFLFGGGPEPPAPHTEPGEDPTEDALGCRGF